MDNRELIAALVDSLAWPVVGLIVLLAFRSVLPGMLNGPIRRWKAGPGGLEVEYWDRESAEVRQVVASVAPPQPQVPPFSTVTLVEELGDVARVAPAAAVVEAFNRLEVELIRSLERAGIELGAQYTRPTELARLAASEGVVSQSVMHAFEDMRTLRNLAAHGRTHEELDTARALDYLDLADGVVNAIHAGRSA